MAEVKWIKITTDLFDDEKIKYIETMPNGDETIVIWFRLMCLAGRSNSSGFLMLTDKVYYTEELLSSIFRRDIKSIQLALSLFQQLDMIEIIDNKIYLSNWDKHQSLDKLEQKKAYDREYQRLKRDEKVKSLENRTTIVRANNDNRITDIDIELDKDIKNKNNNKDIVGKTFVKPTIDEIKSYCLERKNNVDPDEFYDFYESKGWLIGKNKMKDWRASVRTWERNNKNKPMSKSNQFIEHIPDYSSTKSNMSDDEIDALKQRLSNLKK